MTTPAFDMPSFRLDGRVALVTGGGRGLGLGAALALAHAGAAVAVVARTAEQVNDAADRVRALGREALGIVADVTDPDAAGTCAAQVVAHFGRLDVLVYAAGVNVRLSVPSPTMPLDRPSSSTPSRR